MRRFACAVQSAAILLSTVTASPSFIEVHNESGSSELSSNDFLDLCKRLPSNVVQWARKLFHPTGSLVYHFDLAKPPEDKVEFFRRARQKMTEVEVWQSWHSAVKMLDREMEEICERVQEIDRESEFLIHQKNTLDQNDLFDAKPSEESDPDFLANWNKRREEREIQRQKYTSKLQRLGNEREMRMSEHDAFQAQLHTFRVKIGMVPQEAWRSLVQAYVNLLEGDLTKATQSFEECETKPTTVRERVEKQNDMLKVKVTLTRLRKFLTDTVGQ